MKKILVVDDEVGTRESLHAIFWNTHEVLTAESAADAFEVLRKTQVDLILLDLIMPEKSGIEFFKEVRGMYPDLPVIMVSAATSTSTMAEAIRLGAVDFISKPFDVADVRTIAERALKCADMRRQLEANRRESILEYPLHNIVGESPSFRIVMHNARNLAASESSFLMLGERGSGIELLARYIHSMSSRNNQPFITLHGSSLPETLVEAELFGKERSCNSPEIETLGRLDLANSGTFLLKEVHALSPSIQKKLVRVLKDGVFQRANSHRDIKTSARIIFTSSIKLNEESGANALDKELLSELTRNVLEVPSLRERREDIPLLAHCFLNYFRQRTNAVMSDIDSRAMELFREYTWPGNVKELSNVIERIVFVHGNRNCLRPEFLPYEIQARASTPVVWPKLQGTLENTINALQRELITQALVQAKGKHNGAARLLGTTPRILNYRIKQLNLKSAVP